MVIGMSCFSQYSRRVIPLLQDAGMIPLPTLGGPNRSANMISNRGQAVGFAENEVRERLAHPAPGANGQAGTPMPAAGLPVITYNNEIVFNMNGKEIHLIPIPRAHTDGDTPQFNLRQSRPRWSPENRP
jgi:hypothetical protein